MSNLIFAFLLIFSAQIAFGANDSTTIYLSQQPVKPGDTQVILLMMANSSQPSDIAAMQNLVTCPKWLTLSELKPLKANGEEDDTKTSFLGKTTEDNEQKTRVSIFFANSQTQAQTGNFSVAKLIFKVTDVSHQFQDKDSFIIGLDSIKISTFEANTVLANTRTSLKVLVGKDTSATDTSSTDSTVTKYQVRLSLDKDLDSQGFNLNDRQVKVAVNLEFKATVSQVQFAVTVPDSNWKLKNVELKEPEKNYLLNQLGGGRYKLLFTGDNDNHPFLPDPNKPKRTIAYLTFQLSDQTPFGEKLLELNSTGVGSLYETETLTINKQAFLGVNLNKLFGKKIGRKGDLDFLAEWTFGDGLLNQSDINLLTKYIMEEIEFNDYQLWAADLNDDGKVDAGDLSELQKLVKISGIEIDDNQNIRINHSHSTLSFEAQDLDLKLTLYNYFGQTIQSIGNQEQINTNQLSGCYFYQISDRAGKILAKGKLIL